MTTETITSRQQEIIEAAGKILTQSGVGGLTIKKLAQEMGFSEPAVYRHFKSKEDIVLTMLHYLAGVLDEVYKKAINAEDTPEQQLLSLFHHKQAFFKGNPHFAIVVFSDGLLEESTLINEAIHEIMQLKQKYLTPIIVEGLASGAFKSSLTVADITHLLMGSLRLQMLKWRMAGFSFDIVAAGDRQLQIILQLIKN